MSKERTPRPHGTQKDDDPRNVRPEWTVFVVCTDRGQHASVAITRINGLLNADGERSRHMPLLEAKGGIPPWYPPDNEAREGEGVSRSSYQFGCPKCGRHVRVDRDRWWDSVRRLVTEVGLGAGLDSIDISLLS